MLQVFCYHIQDNYSKRTTSTRPRDLEIMLHRIYMESFYNIFAQKLIYSHC